MVSVAYKWFVVSCVLMLGSIASPQSVEWQRPAPVYGMGMSHPLYIAVTEINHNGKEKTLEISCKFFAEDFEETVKKNYKTIVDISSEKDKPTLDRFIPDYISKHLTLSVNGKALTLSYVGYEKENEFAYCYFQVDNVASVKKLDVSNSILHDFNTGQINIVHALAGGKRQSTKLDYPARQASFTF